MSVFGAPIHLAENLSRWKFDSRKFFSASPIFGGTNFRRIKFFLESNETLLYMVKICLSEFFYIFTKWIKHLVFIMRLWINYGECWTPSLCLLLYFSFNFYFTEVCSRERKFEKFLLSKFSGNKMWIFSHWHAFVQFWLWRSFRRLLAPPIPLP